MFSFAGHLKHFAAGTAGDAAAVPRRRVLLGAAAFAACASVGTRTRADPVAPTGTTDAMTAVPPFPLPIADAHSHIGMFRLSSQPLAQRMRESGVTLLAWAAVGDTRWTQRTRRGIEQQATPAPGEQTAYVKQRLATLRQQLQDQGLDLATAPADVEAARRGVPRVVLALEGAGLAEDGLEGLDAAWATGLRHLQLVHYVRNGLGDLQTLPPVHDGLTPLGVEVIARCNTRGMLVDLAHCAPSCVERALEVARKPMVWSHSSVSLVPRSWREPSNHSRLLELRLARRIAEAGGAIGLWALRDTVHSAPAGYADEILRMVDLLGPAHVMFGTDIEGMGSGAAMSELTDLRAVADELARRGVDDATLRAVCFDNYARCLVQAMQA